MKLLKSIVVGIVVTGFLTSPLSAFAAEKSADKSADQKTEKKVEKKEKLKPYVLKVCPVSDEKLGGEMKPYVFAHEGREIKLCCKDCLADFKKDTAKFIKKIEVAEQKLPKKSDSKSADKKEKTKS